MGHLGWLWLLWGRRGAVAARSGGYGGTTDLEAVAFSVGAGGVPLGWWFNVPTTTPENARERERVVVKARKGHGEHNAKFGVECVGVPMKLHPKFRMPAIVSVVRADGLPAAPGADMNLPREAGGEMCGAREHFFMY